MLARVIEILADKYKVSINDLLNPEAAVRDEDTLKLISRLSKNLFETYISVPDEHRAELEKKLIAYMNEFKSQKNCCNNPCHGISRK